MGIPIKCSPFFYKQNIFNFNIVLFFLDFIFREKGEERNITVWLPLARPLVGTWPATQACALTGNITGNPLVCRPAFSPLSHTSQGCSFLFLKNIF